MDPGIKDYDAYHGNDFTDYVTILDGSVVRDISGDKAWMEIRKISDNTIVAKLSTELADTDTGCSITADGTNERFVLSMTPAATSTIPVGVYVYGLKVKAAGASGRTDPVLEGMFAMHPFTVLVGS
jgi:hypothetical protein